MEALIIKLMYGFNRWLSLTLCIVPWGSRMEIVSFPVAQWPKWKIWHCWQESYRHRFVRVCVCVHRWMDGYLKCDFVACLRNWNCTEMFISKAATNDSWDVCIWMSLLTPARSYSSHDIILVTAVFLFFFSKNPNLSVCLLSYFKCEAFLAKRACMLAWLCDIWEWILCWYDLLIGNSLCVWVNLTFMRSLSGFLYFCNFIITDT